MNLEPDDDFPIARRAFDQLRASAMSSVAMLDASTRSVRASLASADARRRLTPTTAPASVDRRPAACSIDFAEREQRLLVERPADQLQAERQAFGRQAGRRRQGPAGRPC